MKIERLMFILVTLLSQKYIKAKDIAELYQVSVRTIYRDIDTLSLVGIPIYSKQGNEGGFYLEESYKLNSLFFSDMEKQAIYELSQSVATNYQLPKLEELSQKMAYLTEKSENNSPYFFDLSLWKTNQLVLKEMEKSIETKKVLAFDYTSYHSETTHREVEPINLVCKSHVWYLYAYCLLRKEVRLFRINRIRNVKLLNQDFSSGEHQTIEKQDLDNYYQAMSKKIEMIQVHLIFDLVVKGKVYDNFLETDIEETDNQLIVKKEMPFEDWLIEFLLGFRGSVKVIEPSKLREVIIQEAQTILAQYDIRVSQ